LAPVAFPTWRVHWARLEGIEALLAEADRLLARRASGNHCIPAIVKERFANQVAMATRVMRAWAEGELPEDVADRPDLVRRIHRAIHPVLPIIYWPRWLMLERAFLDASSTGDLLFAALTLRTMCEELQRLHALDLSAHRLAHLAASSATEDRERLELYFSVTWTSLGPLPEEMLWEGEGWPSMKLIDAAMPVLERARRSLNSYVHPNYGSHIAALFPERSAAARLLLEAVVIVHKAFFALSWANLGVEHGTALGVEPLEGWPLTMQRLQSEILPEVQRNPENEAVAQALRVPSVIEWLGKDHADVAEMLRRPALAPLLEGLPRQTDSDGSGGGPQYALWEGASVLDIMELAMARNAEQGLATEFPSGAPEASEQIGWLRFNRLSLELAMMLDSVKASAFKTQLVRQIVEGNDLAIQLCVRSLIEHRALAVWLPKTLRISLMEMAAGVRAGAPLPGNVSELEQPLANFLLAQAKGSREDRRSWVIDQAGNVRTAWLNLATVVRSAFPEEDRFHKFYALASAAMHGRIGRGLESLSVEEGLALNTRRVGLIVLDRICNWDEEIGYIAAATFLSKQLDHAQRYGGTSRATNDAIAQRTFGLIEGPLSPGADYTGEGTPDDPYRLAAHLEYYQASYALLRQMGVDVSNCPRQLAVNTGGRFCDRWRAPDREYWFLVNLGSWRSEDSTL
jgi:hypothetical protein